MIRKHIQACRAAIVTMAFLVSLTSSFCSTSIAAEKGRIPVILDSDIGDDIDDTWALGLMLKSPELDVKLVVGDNGKGQYRASLLAKFLEQCGRTDIPVGIGPDVNHQGGGNQSKWIEGYDLKKYPGKVYEDGVQAIIDVIMKSTEPVTIIAIGPVPNLAQALKKEPKIAKRVRIAGMHGSVRIGYGGSKQIHAEYNVKEDVKSCQTVFTAPWEMVITPLDTCGLVELKGDQYATLKNSKDVVVKTILENYAIWCGSNFKDDNKTMFERQSTILFDTVAVYLSFTDSLTKIEELGITVDDEGFTRIDPKGKKMEVATEWKDLPAYNQWLVKRLTSPIP